MNRRLIAAAILSPIAAPLFLSFLIVGISMFQSGRNFVESVVPIASVGLPLAYAFLFLVGLPVFFVLRKMHALSVLSVTVLGGIIPPCFVFIIILAGGASFNDVFYKSLMAYVAVGGCGFFTSLVFWLIAYGRKWRIS